MPQLLSQTRQFLIFCLNLSLERNAHAALLALLLPNDLGISFFYAGPYPHEQVQQIPVRLVTSLLRLLILRRDLLRQSDTLFNGNFRILVATGDEGELGLLQVEFGGYDWIIVSELGL